MSNEDTVLAEVRALSKQIETLTKVITGNGHPEEGLTVQFFQLRDSVKNCQSQKFDYIRNNQLSAKNRIAIYTAIIASITSIAVAFLK